MEAYGWVGGWGVGPSVGLSVGLSVGDCRGIKLSGESSGSEMRSKKNLSIEKGEISPGLMTPRMTF